METDKVISFDNRDYRIVKTIYRTIGSADQLLTTAKGDKTEPRRIFYIVECGDKLFWVKEYINPAAYHDIDYEFAETKRLHSTTPMGLHEISTPKMFCVENGRILMEYCDGYKKIHEVPLNPPQRDVVRSLIAKWIKEHPDVHNYDMCANNILVRKENISGILSVRLIDFEYSLKMSHHQWTGTRNAECWMQLAATIKFWKSNKKGE